VAVAAVLFAIITVFVGVIVLGDVVGLPGSGLKRLAATHVGVATTGVILLLIALVNANRGTAWISFGALLLAGTIGVLTLTLNRPPQTEESASRKEQGHLPLPVVVIHGALAVLTLLLVLATASSAGLMR
jgi:hypothetical protein